MRRSISILFIACLAMAAAALVVAGDVGAETGAVPFEGSYSGTCTFVSLSFPVLTKDCSATGQATHVGNSSEDMLVHVNVLTGAATAAVTLTAANGDEIFATTAGSTTSTGGGEAAISGTQTVSGGTGRFEGATGSFTFTGTVTMGPGPIAYTLEGSIAY